MFKFGTNKERGCIGKKIGCNEFHPSQCKDYFDGKCEKDCCGRIAAEGQERQKA